MDKCAAVFPGMLDSMTTGTSRPPPSPYRRILSIALLAGGISQLILSASSTPASSGSAVLLVPGRPISGQIGPGQTRTFEVNVPAKQVVKGAVASQGIDIVVRIFDPQGALVSTVDEAYNYGAEPWTLMGKQDGLWRLEVSPFTPKAVPGTYQTSISEVVTMEQYIEQRAVVRYDSPRMLALWQEYMREGVVAVERFAREMDGHAPIVEPAPDDPKGNSVLLTFPYFAPPEVPYVGFTAALVATTGESGMQRFEKTNLFYFSVPVPKDALFTYTFHIMGDEPNTAATAQQLETFTGRYLLDPWNPLVNEKSSQVTLPSTPVSPWPERIPGVPEGRVVPSTLHSNILDEDRKLGVYLPASYSAAGGPYPFIVIFDGNAYGLYPDQPIPAPTILDNLIAKGKVPPMLAVLVDAQATRNTDLTMSSRFCDFVVQELVPWVHKNYRATDDPKKTTLAGSSLGGLEATYCSFHHPDVFGSVLSQSGSFWYAPGADVASRPYDVEPGAMIREVLGAPRKPLKLWMTVGLFEGGGLLIGANMIAQSRSMRDMLTAKGYDFTYLETATSHDYICWRGWFGDGLINLAGVKD
jgi:enterochelin esterase-like enzyme